MITVREYHPDDALTLHQLFFETIRTVNIQHYSQQQVEAWAPEQRDTAKWQEQLNRLSPFVAEINGVIAGYADVQDSGLVDHFFCSYQFQGQGVGKVLMNAIHQKAKRLKLEKLHAHVSKTANPFFTHFGFEVKRPQQVVIRGVELTNFYMEKSLI